MRSLFAWEWKKHFMPPAVAKKRNVMVKIFDVAVAECSKDRYPDPTALRHHDTVFITGDGKTLAHDVQDFNSWNVPHDIYAVNRSLVFHEKPVTHWAAVDVEEAAWFTEFATEKVNPDNTIIRHSIGSETKHGNPLYPGMYDLYWEMVYEWENEFQRMVFVGNSGYFAVLSALKMGYSRVVMGGMPLDTSAHFYEPDDAQGPLWTGATYMQWMDFKMQVPEAERVRSLSGYSAFILGKATKEWASNG
jgi:hypothetical protein